jgi:adenosylhomocysteinase
LNQQPTQIPYEVRDIGLAPSGHQKIAWVRDHMPLLRGMEEEFAKTKPFDGIKISLSIHMEAKTAYLCQVLAIGGAQVAATGSNVLSTQDDVAAALADFGINIYAYHAATGEEYHRHLEMALAQKSNIIIDDGGDLVGMLHQERPDLAVNVWGGCEETTTGIIRLRAMEQQGVLRFPMVAVNDADCKHLFDNRYGTGQSVWDSIMRNTNLIIAGKTVVVGGYGWCGRGIAQRADALGASVVVTEINPIRAMEAKMDGYAIMPMEKAAPLGDIFVTATGCAGTIRMEHMMQMKDGAILSNAGHFNVEVDVAALEANAMEKSESRKNIMGYTLPNGNRLHLIGDGRLVNIAAADGHPAEIMDLSFAVQIMSALYIKEHHKSLTPAVIDVSKEMDQVIANKMLKSWGVEIDVLTPDQQEYLKSWQV